MEWALVIFFFANTMAKGDENSTSVVQGFATAELCAQAQRQVMALPTGYKSATSACVRVK